MPHPRRLCCSLHLPPLTRGSSSLLRSSPNTPQRLREAVASFGTSPAILRKRRRIVGNTPGSAAGGEASAAHGAAGSALKEPQSVGGPSFDDLLCSPSPQSPGVAMQRKQLFAMLDGAVGAPGAAEGAAALTPSAGAFTPLPTGGGAPTESLTAQLTSTGTDIHRLSLAGSVGGGAGSIRPPLGRPIPAKAMPLDLDGLLSPGRAGLPTGLDGSAHASRHWRAQNNRVSGFFQRRLPASKMGLEFDRVASAPAPGQEPDVLAVMRAVEDHNAPLYARAEELRGALPAPLREQNALDALAAKAGVAPLAPAAECGAAHMTPQAGSKLFSGLGFSPFALGGPSPLDAAGTPGDHLRIAGELGLTDTPAWTMRMCR